MSNATEIDVLIIGAGPAGLSTALHLVQADPSWAGRILLVDKAVHPREKLCGGGITRLGMPLLRGLGVSLKTPYVPVREVRMVYRHLVFAIRDEPVFWVVRRDEFDHHLARTAARRGAALQEGEAVLDVRPAADGVEVATTAGEYRARVVVAADGSRSTVRQKLDWPGSVRMARLLEVLTPESDHLPEFQQGRAVFDFSPMADGLQGYCWDFPSLVRGQATMNRGVFDSRIRPERRRAGLKEILQERMAARQRRLADYPLKGHPIHLFDPQAVFARPRVLLAGDAAGTDPLLGEGISFALAYGQAAAAEIVHAFAQNDFSFTGYKARLLAHPVLSQLRVRAWLARMAYRFESPGMIGMLWRLAPWMVAALARYNPACVPVQQPRLVRVG